MLVALAHGGGRIPLAPDSSLAASRAAGSYATPTYGGAPRNAPERRFAGFQLSAKQKAVIHNREWQLFFGNNSSRTPHYEFCKENGEKERSAGAKILCLWTPR